VDSLQPGFLLRHSCAFQVNFLRLLRSGHTRPPRSWLLHDFTQALSERAGQVQRHESERAGDEEDGKHGEGIP
jgi:hypothetical protein